MFALLVWVPGRQRYRVRDDRRRDEDRGTSRGGGSSNYESKRPTGSTSWPEGSGGGDKGYLGGLGKYSHKKEAVSAAVAGMNSTMEQNGGGYGNAAVYAYDPQTNSVTPAYSQQPTAVPAAAVPYGPYPYQNGTAVSYTGYQQQAMPYAAATPSAMPVQPPQPQQVYYAPPPPPPPPPGQ